MRSKIGFKVASLHARRVTILAYMLFSADLPPERISKLRILFKIPFQPTHELEEGG